MRLPSKCVSSALSCLNVTHTGSARVDDDPFKLMVQKTMSAVYFSPQNFAIVLIQNHNNKALT